MRRGRPRHEDILTPREWQVLRLVREGLTNEQIAERLQISLAGAKYHVSEILAKLDVPTREDAVDAASRHRQSWLLLPLQCRFRGKQSATPALLVTAALLLAAIFGLATIRLPHGKHSGATPAPDTAGVGLDLAPDGDAASDAAQTAPPYPHTILLAKDEPQNLGDSASLIASLRRVRTLSELQAALTPSIHLIVVDASSAQDLSGTDFLQQQILAGRAIIELNVCQDELFTRDALPPQPSQGGVVTEISLDGTVRHIEVKPDAAQRTPQCAWVDERLAAAIPVFSLRRIASQTELDRSRQQGRGVSPGSSGQLRPEVFEPVLRALDASSIGNCEALWQKDEWSNLCPSLTPPLPNPTATP